MRNTSLIGLMLLGSLLAAGRAPSAADKQEAEVVSLERAALDRWGKGDVNGFLEIYAPEITYFDAGTQRRMDGHAAMTSYLQPFTGKILRLPPDRELAKTAFIAIRGAILTSSPWT